MRFSKLYEAYCLLTLAVILTFPSSFTQREIDGKKLYKKYCKSCHGRKGGLGLKGATNLKKLELGLEERISSITKGKGSMASFESILTKDEIKAVAHFTESLKK